MKKADCYPKNVKGVYFFVNFYLKGSIRMKDLEIMTSGSTLQPCTRRLNGEFEWEVRERLAKMRRARSVPVAFRPSLTKGLALSGLNPFRL